jgi:hypothetical protein
MLHFGYTTLHLKICIKNTVIDFAATRMLEEGVVIRQEVATLVAEVQVAGGDQIVPSLMYHSSLTAKSFQTMCHHGIK